MKGSWEEATNWDVSLMVKMVGLFPKLINKASLKYIPDKKSVMDMNPQWKNEINLLV
jgi:hypothetical protein